MDKLMKTADYRREAHEYVKTLNHYQKHALLIELSNEVGIMIESEEANILLPAEQVLSYIDLNPFTIICALDDQETVCWQSKFAESPKLNINGNLKRGRKKNS
jgi:hypothetical protein